MASFEGIVRPVVFPNIRPAQARPLVPGSGQEAYVIRGSSGQTLELTITTSASVTVASSVEEDREFDTARVYQEEDDGVFNKENFIDVQVAKKIGMRSSGPPQRKGGPGIGVPERQQGDPIPADRRKTNYYYTPVKESPGVEIINRDQVDTSGASEGQ